MQKQFNSYLKKNSIFINNGKIGLWPRPRAQIHESPKVIALIGFLYKMYPSY